MKLQKWTEAANYEGLNYTGYLIAAQRFFRCTQLERATFAYIREAMHDLGGGQDVIDVTFQDECLVARYVVLVAADFAKGVRMAEMFQERLARKGYVDPDTVELRDEDMDDDVAERRPIPEAPFGAAEPTGKYFAVKVDHGNSGGSLTTFVVQRKSRAVERETAKRQLLAADIEVLTGIRPALVARSIDGINRRWKGVKAHTNDDVEANPIER